MVAAAVTFTVTEPKASISETFELLKLPGGRTS